MARHTLRDLRGRFRPSGPIRGMAAHAWTWRSRSGGWGATAMRTFRTIDPAQWQQRHRPNASVSGHATPDEALAALAKLWDARYPSIAVVADLRTD